MVPSPWVFAFFLADTSLLELADLTLDLTAELPSIEIKSVSCQSAACLIGSTHSFSPWVLSRWTTRAAEPERERGRVRVRGRPLRMRT